MPESSEAEPSSRPSERPGSAAISRRRSSGNRAARSRAIRPRATSTISQRSDASNLSSGLQQLSWTTGDCFDYVDGDANISAFLYCPICLGPFLDPFASNICSHTFCKQCITTALSDDPSSQQVEDELASGTVSKRCPSCRTSVELSDFQPTALLIKNMVDTLQVRCPNKDKGCNYECERHLLRGHVVSDCEYEYVDQNLNEGKRCGCSAKVMRKDWASHGLSCPKRKTTCSTCDATLCFDELEEHCRTCSPEPAVCEFCNLQTIKSRLSLHITDECQEAPMLCPHAAFGCAWVGPRRRLQRPLDTASKSTEQSHLNDECRFEPIKAFFGVFSQHVNELRDENAALKARLDEMESRQHGQVRRLDDCVHSLGSWYRSAGELQGTGLDQRARGSQMGVDGEWDEFPLDAQNWERSLSQQSFATRRSRAQSTSAVTSMDLASWARSQYSDYSVADLLGPADLSSQSHRASGSSQAAPFDEVVPSHSRYLAPPTARSMPTPSPLPGAGSAHISSPSRERMSYLARGDSGMSTRRSEFGSMPTALEGSSLPSTSAVSPGSYGFPPPTATTSTTQPIDMERDLDRSSLDAAIATLTASMAGLSSGLNSLDKRTEEGHIAAVKAGFDAGRVQEEVASLRHGLHAVRMQIHQILMQQQRYALFATPGMGAMAAPIGGSTGNLHEAAAVGAGPSTSTGGSMPMLSPPLLRRWAGLEHTKL